MDKTPKSISSSCNNEVPEETGMDKVWSDLNALKKLYGLLQRLDETSRALLKKLLDDATRQALLKQPLTTASDSAIPFSLGLTSPKNMDQTTSSSSSFHNNKEAEMEQILSDLEALTKLYSLLHKGPADENLDEASMALLMKILEDATQEAVRRQAKILSGSLVSPALERKLSTRSDCQTRHTDPCLRPVASPRPSLLASEQSRRLNLQHSTVSRRSGLHGDGHRHAAEEPPPPRPSLLDSERQRRLNLQHSTVSRQSGIHGDGHRHAAEEPPPPRPSLLDSERPRRLNLQYSTVSRRSGLHGDGHGHAAEEPPLARLASKCSSKTALPARHRPSQEQRHSSLSLHRFPGAGTSRHGTVTGGTRLADRRDSINRSSGRGDQCSLERSSSSRSRSSGRSVSRELSLGPSSRLHGRATPRHVEADQWSLERSRSSSRSSSRRSVSPKPSLGPSSRLRGRATRRHVEVDQCSLERSSSSRSSSRRSVSREPSLGPSSRLRGRATRRHVEAESSSSVHLFERLDSGLFHSMTSRHGVEHAGRGVATPERSSSSNTMATIQSRIRPSKNLLKEGSLRRSAAEQTRTLRGRQQGSDVSSVNMYNSSISSGSRSSLGAASLSASMSPPASPPPRAFANKPYYYSPPMMTRGVSPPAPRAFAKPYYYSPPVMTRDVAPPVYAPKVSRSMRRRRRQEILEKRVARLRMLKDKIATVFHHPHDDHHHHHHHLGGGQEAGPSSRSIVRGAAGHLNSPWQYLTSIFHHAKGKAKNIRSRTVVGVPEKRRGGGGGGNIHALFDAVQRHLKSGKRRAPAVARGGGGNNMHALFDAVQRHLKGKRRAPPGIKLRRKGSRVRGKKMHHRWQRGMAAVTAGSKPRHRLGHGKAGWL